MKRPKTPQIKTPQVKTPQFVQDLVRDLRDRRLLLPAIALVVALIAVPVLMTSSSEPAPAAPVASAPVEGAEAVTPAVLAEQAGIRDYRERLDSVGKNDPFAQKFAAPKAEDVAIEETGSSTGSSVPTPSLDDALAQATGTSPPSDTSSGSPGVEEPDSGAAQPDGGNVGQPKPEIRFVVGRVDVSFGPADNPKEIEGVRELDLLPDAKNPLVSFIGLAGNGDHAVFGITPTVVETRGDGTCSPGKPDACQFLRLGEGGVRILKTSSGKTFELKLLETDLVRVPNPDDD